MKMKRKRVSWNEKSKKKYEKNKLNKTFLIIDESVKRLEKNKIIYDEGKRIEIKMKNVIKTTWKWKRRREEMKETSVILLYF